MLKNTIKKSLMNLCLFRILIVTSFQNSGRRDLLGVLVKTAFRNALENFQNYVCGDIFFSKVARQKTKVCKKSRPDY